MRCRRKRMQGYEVLWLPGMDHAAIAMQTMVERKLAAEGKTRDDLGREAFIERVWQEKAEISGNIGEQMRRLGDGVDWTRERFTMDEGLSRAVHTVFKKMFDDGLIYQAERLVNWSPVLQTAISDIEVSTPTSRASWSASGTVPSTTRSRTSWWRRPGWRRCSATPRLPCTPTTNATAIRGHRTAAPVPRPQHPDRRRRLRGPRNSARARSRSPGTRPQRLRARAAAQPADADDHGRDRPDRRNWNAIRRHGPLRGAGRGAQALAEQGASSGGAAVPAQCRTLERR